MNYLLDTNSWIDHLRHGPNSKVTARLAALQEDTVFLCSVVLGEMLDGAYRSGATHQKRNLALVATLRQRFASLPFDDAAAEEYGKARAHLASLGTPIGPNDLLVASMGLAGKLVVVTHNTVEFCRVPGLILEDWQ